MVGIESLSDLEKIVLTLRHFEKFSLSEIEYMIGSPGAESILEAALASPQKVVERDTHHTAMRGYTDRRPWPAGRRTIHILVRRAEGGPRGSTRATLGGNVCSVYWRDDIDMAQEATVDQALKDRSTEPAVHDLPLEHLEHEICQLSAPSRRRHVPVAGAGGRARPPGGLAHR
ncbi:MAG: hypothetical protein H0U41_11275, partial [Actinobacteria bacterium]|nr:hypothetical protein [Actinomycetota bacterium]